MEKIMKVIMSFNDDKTIKKIIVVTENEIERYTCDALSKEELINIYNQCIKELVNDYKEELNGLSQKEKLNKLVELKLLERNENNLIVNLTESEDPVKFTVQYENGQKEYNENDMDTEEYMSKYSEILKLILETYGIKANDSDEIISKLEKLGLYSEYKEKKTLPDNKISNLSVRKKWILGILGTGVVAAIVYGGIELLKNNHNDNSHDENTIELQSVETPTPTPYDNVEEVEYLVFEQPTVVPTPEPTPFIPTPTPYVKEIYIANEDNIFPNYVEAEDKSIVIKETNGFSFYGNNDDLDHAIEIRNQNMDSLENHIQSNIDINDKGYYIYFENMFNDSDIEDKAFVKYFSMFGNQIIKCGYVDNNFGGNTGVNNYSIMSCMEVVHRIRDNHPITVYINGEERKIYYSNLSNKAKNAVLNIAWSNYTVLNSNPELYKLSDMEEEVNIPEIHYDNEVLTKSDIADILTAAYEELSMIK